MNKEIIYEIKKEDKKALHKYAASILISLFIGLVIGVITILINEGTTAVWIAESLLYFLMGFFPVANIIITVGLMFPVIYLYKKCRKLYQVWDGESEEDMNKIETSLSYALWVTSILQIMSFFFFATGAYFIHDYENLKGTDLIYWLTGFIAAVICTIVAQQKIINFEKEMNPEKQGSIFDQKFSKKWEKSCDEAERLSIYKSAYTSYRAVTVTCLLLWGFCVIGANLWNFGLIPVTVISIIWLVHVSSYCIKSISLSKYSAK